MNIEKYWSDITIYYITFIINNGHEKKTIERTFVFDSDIDEKEIKTKIFNYFDNIESIEHIDFWDQGLLKNENYEYLEKYSIFTIKT